MFALDVTAHNGRWRLRHPGEKAFLAFGLLGCAVALPTWPGAALAGGTAAALLLGPARVSAVVLLRAARVPVLFVTTSAVPLLVAVQPSGGVSWNPNGAGEALTATGRALAALLCLLLFSATTPLSDVIPRLRRLGVPAAVTEVASVTYRMIFLLVDSLRTVREAQAARLGYRSWRAAYRSLAGQAAAVFVRAFARARRLEEGLALRGYAGSLAVRVEPRRVSPGFVAATLALLAAVVVASLSLRGPS
ncbi:cobalt ECF transporter T component CbiQ [Micromonospora peucetia]|uniref:cobalt ECF transporter T component CbiQ n=1 Tax=Micromonospora peucetia TaxID=47871 RepID=UPI003331DCC6